MVRVIGGLMGMEMGTCMHEGKWVAKEVGLQGIKKKWVWRAWRVEKW